MNFYTQVVSAEDPLRKIRTMTDHGLVQLIDEVGVIKSPNKFHASVFATAMSEAVLRWKQSLVSLVDDEGVHESRVTGQEDQTVRGGIFTKP